MRRAIGAKKDRVPGHSFSADETNLNAIGIAIGDDRSETAFEEVDVFDRAIARFERFPKR
jgi:hypothetical protein